MKKTTILLLSLVLCAGLLCACGGGNEAADSFSVHPDADGHVPDDASAPAEATSGSAAAGTTGEGGGTNANATSGAESEFEETIHSFSGIIADAAMSKFYVELEDGQTLELHYEEADLSGLTDSRPGNPVVVYYTGTLNGNDTSGITVVRMETPE